MIVSDLIAFLQTKQPDATVLIRIDGSIYPTEGVAEHNDYNDGAEGEVFVLASDD